MKNRIWNQTESSSTCHGSYSFRHLRTISGNAGIRGRTGGSRLLNIEQSAKWTDEENYKAELTLRLSGLNTLKDVSKVDQEQEKIQAEMETESFTEDAREKAEEDFGKVEQRRKLKLQRRQKSEKVWRQAKTQRQKRFLVKLTIL